MPIMLGVCGVASSDVVLDVRRFRAAFAIGSGAEGCGALDV